VGACAEPVVVIDEFTGATGELVEIAAALAPFPAASNNYPGLRRVIGPSDAAAAAYVERMLEAAAPFIGGGFDVDSFRCVEASFSLVTTPPTELSPPQRAPHFDSTNPGHLALLHYLVDAPGSGTGFFRQRSTGIEVVDETNVRRFVATATQEGGGPGYIAGGDPRFEEIGRVEAVRDRLVIYRGALLHSGIIPPELPLSADPRRGRLTANLFVQAA
jgi:hypothetical protein